MVTKISGGRRNQNSAQILVILKDVNDNAPELEYGLSWSISENAEVVGYGLSITCMIYIFYLYFTLQLQ